MINLDELEERYPPQDREVFEKAYTETALSYELAEVVRGLRDQHNMSQTELARRLGTTQSAVARMESIGYLPNGRMLEKVAQVFNVKLRVTAIPQGNNSEPDTLYNPHALAS